MKGQVKDAQSTTERFGTRLRCSLMNYSLIFFDFWLIQANQCVEVGISK